MPDKAASYPFSAQPFQCDFSGRIFLTALCNELLNCAEHHASERGFGIANLAGSAYTWVIARLAVEINSMPQRDSACTIETWIENVFSLFTNRNFAILNPNKQPIGYARSTWVLINTSTHKTADLTSYDQLRAYELPDKPCPIDKPRHIKPGGTPLPTSSIQMKYSDTDINQHVNSIKYIEHILNLFPISWHQTHRITRLDITYTTQAHAGDTLIFAPAQTSPNTYNINVRNQENEERVCRAQIQTSPQ